MELKCYLVKLMNLQDTIDELIAREEYLYEKVEKEQSLALSSYKAGRIQGCQLYNVNE